MASNRVVFQWQYFSYSPKDSVNPKILNVGCSDDPIGLGDVAMHVDLDDWSAYHKHFTQANADNLPFTDKSYHTVIYGDIIEHVVNVRGVLEEACRVCSDLLVLTIFEEWRLHDYGQWIEEGQKRGDEEAQKYGYEDREEMQLHTHPARSGVDDTAVPHLIHINQFTDVDIEAMALFIEDHGFERIETYKAPEGVHEGHEMFNWLLSFRRLSKEELDANSDD